MIVKIQRYGSRQKFWMIDNIAKVGVSESLLKSNAVKGLMPSDVEICDVPKKCSCGNGPEDMACSKCVSYVDLTCRKADGEEFTITFDTIAYIMNDQGSTIEKVVANYNPVEEEKRQKD
jgi:hypothetical protein